MGLDIVAYKKLKKIEFNNDSDQNEDLETRFDLFHPGGSMTVSEECWPESGYPLEVDAYYSFEDYFSFRAGSYSYYNKWRDDLELFKGDCAFQELINFSDCEGVIGPLVAEKLYYDFKDYHEEAIKYAEALSENWLKEYEDWMYALELAKDNGAILFC